ncbi:hypothetical protein [Clostridium botulinum]|uniref:hypothetical protein n=1 Tax=Clostridium botulinum TaxID=1491 RepID=UPI0013F06D6E|nr:hypothetical protein [Clostridium botulinum]EGT5649342.1 hypothetical protein [Clostridium botulinum]MBY6755543.1 hypothetical protein [Clostridium botulinum]MBY6766470.1 hypothetical protein [Clostridium botulinum]MBY6900459.1 hypothetical protein [Clostridium botulinum]MBY6914766.1 hypothetical protein [Clostridium botulinum]
MKKTISFNLEEDIIEKIEKYQVKNNLSSRSAALERIILKLDSSSIDQTKIKEIIKEIINETSITYDEVMEKNVDKKVEELNNKDLDKSIENVFADMPE